MKTQILYPIALSAALVALPGGAQGQDDDLAAVPAGLAPVAPGAYEVGLDLVAGDNESALLRQLEELDAATARKRAELKARLAQLKQQQRAELLAQQSSKHRDNGPGHLASPFGPAPSPQRWMIGVQVSPGNPDGGVRVDAVMDKMPAAKAGMRAGDVIESVNAIRVRDVGALNAIINAAGDQPLELGIRREGEEIEIKLTPGKVAGGAPFNVPIPGPDDPFGDGGVDRLRGYRLKPGQEGLVPPLTPFGDKVPGRARVFPNAQGSAEIESLKNDIADLRKLVEELVGKGKPAAGEDGTDGATDSAEAGAE